MNKLGNQKPSTLTNHLFTLLGDFSTDILIQHVFLHSLLAYVQDAIAGSDVTDLETLGDLARCHHVMPLLPGSPRL